MSVHVDTDGNVTLDSPSQPDPAHSTIPDSAFTPGPTCSVDLKSGPGPDEAATITGVSPSTIVETPDADYQSTRLLLDRQTVRRICRLRVHRASARIEYLRDNQACPPDEVMSVLQFNKDLHGRAKVHISFIHGTGPEKGSAPIWWGRKHTKAVQRLQSDFQFQVLLEMKLKKHDLDKILNVGTKGKTRF